MWISTGMIPRYKTNYSTSIVSHLFMWIFAEISLLLVPLLWGGLLEWFISRIDYDLVI